MIYGIGTDIVELERVSRACRREAFLTRSFTEEELRQADRRTGMLAGDFSVKEAVAKAFGTGVTGFRLREIECLRDERGAPYVRLSGAALELRRRLGIGRIHVSISDCRNYVTAFAVAECAETAGDREASGCPNNSERPEETDAARTEKGKK